MPRSILIWTVVLVNLGTAHAQAPADLVSFDNHQLDLRQVGGHWQLRKGGTFFKDMGTSEGEAREALDVIRALRLTQRGTVGSREPVMEYWLADGQTPRGMIPAYKLQTIDRPSLRVEQLMGHWVVRDSRQIWFNFGRFEKDARQALAILQRYAFNRIGFVGTQQPILIYFTEVPDAATPSRAPPAAAAPISPLQLWQVRQLGQAALLPIDPTTGEEHFPLDWRHIELRRDGAHWKLVLGSQCLADFGMQETDARDALRIVQFYRFTEEGHVGSATKPMTYFLVNGQAPHGIWFGLRTVAFRPERLEVREIGGQWMICDGSRPIVRGGDAKDEALQSLKTIRRYKFDSLCQVGNVEPAPLTFFVRER